MAPFVFQDTRFGVALLFIDNPPVNALGADVRAELWRHLELIEQDDAVVGTVITSTGRMFSGGGDLREVGQIDAPGTVGLAQLCQRIEAFPKPVVAALHGRCIGGGVLLAMACHARIAAPDARLMLPELNLGLVPGAGGTQRLPRLIGVRSALDMVIGARTLAAAVACTQGLIDDVAEGSLVEAAVLRVQAIVDGNLPWRRTAALPIEALDTVAKAALLEEFSLLARQVFPGRDAASEAISLILDADTTTFDAGCMREREAFTRLATGPQARALLYLFFAERALAKSGDACDADASARITDRLLSVCGDWVAGQHARGIPADVIERAVTLTGLRAPPSSSPAIGLGIPADAAMPSVDNLAQELLQVFAEEARRCLHEGLTNVPGHIDVIAVNACGYPALSGGPLHHGA